MHNQVYGGAPLVVIFTAVASISLDGIEVDASFSGRFQDQFQGVVKHFGKTIPEGRVKLVFLLKIAELPFDQLAVQAA
jgi:hypothetical protein